MGGLVVVAWSPCMYCLFACMFQCWGWDERSPWRICCFDEKHPKMAVGSRTSHARDGPTEWPESDRQFMTIPSFHSQVFHLLSCYIAGTRHYPSKMPLWHRGAGPPHRGKQTVGHWKVRTLSATWDIHFKRCWWISWEYCRQCLFQHPLWNQGFSPDNFEC